MTEEYLWPIATLLGPRVPPGLTRVKARLRRLRLLSTDA